MKKIEKNLLPILSLELPKKVKELDHALLTVRNNGWSKDIAKNLTAKALEINLLAKQYNITGIKELTEKVHSKLSKILKKDVTPAKETITIIQAHVEILLRRIYFKQQIETQKIEPSKNINYHSKIIIGTSNRKIGANLKKQFNFYGYKVDIYYKFDAIINIFNNNKSIDDFAVIILDTDICEKQSFSNFDQLPNNIPIIFISKIDNLETRLFAVRAGGRAFFKLPIEFHSLIEKVDELITPISENTPYRILMIEDSKTQANVYKEALTNIGMIVEALNEASRINKRLKEFQPELILMDLYMPNCTGIELASVIRQQEAYVGVPIVFLSSEEDITTQLDAMSLGGDDFLTKPIESKHLISAVTTRVERARALRSEMIQDSLTGLLNHSRILEQLNIEIARAKRDKVPLTFAMIDIDNFKSINDNYGHLIGDSVIKNLSRLLKQRFRKSDSVGRYGGEEYAVILPESTTSQIIPLLEDIRQSFEQIQHKDTKGTNKFNVTFSAGVASYSYKTNTVDKLIDAADKALYAAKQNGRNQIVVYPYFPTTLDTQSK